MNRILFSLATIFEKRAKIKECAQFADKGMAAILNSVYYGASVIEPFALSRSIQNELIQLKQFDPLTTSLLTAVWPAPISAMPHSVPQLNDEMKEGPNVAMTYFRINGYAAECERTFFLSEPTAQEVELFEQMMEARNRALALVRPGVKTADIDAAARDYLESKGLLPTLLHRTGHGVGLGNHEAPFMAIGSDEVLEENMIITIEPGIYSEGEGGYRHSDTILITKDGYELLTKAPLQLHELVLKKSNLMAKVKGKIIKKTLKM